MYVIPCNGKWNHNRTSLCLTRARLIGMAHKLYICHCEMLILIQIVFIFCNENTNNKKIIKYLPHTGIFVLLILIVSVFSFLHSNIFQLIVVENVYSILVFFFRWRWIKRSIWKRFTVITTSYFEIILFSRQNRLETELIWVEIRNKQMKVMKIRLFKTHTQSNIVRILADCLLFRSSRSVLTHV